MRRKQRLPEPDWDTLIRSLERNDGVVFSCPSPEPSKDTWSDHAARGFWMVVSLAVMVWLFIHCPVLFVAFLVTFIFSWP